MDVDIKDKTYRVLRNDQGQILLATTTQPIESEPEEQTQAEILEDFRQGWHEAMTGQTIPITQLWGEIDNSGGDHGI